MSRHERALQRRREARSEVGSSYDPEQSPIHARVASAGESQTPRGSRFLLRDMSFSRTPRNGSSPHGNVDGANLQMQELNAAGIANSTRSRRAMMDDSMKQDQNFLSTPTSNPASSTANSSKRPHTLFLGDQSNYQYTDFGLQASPTSFRTGPLPATGRKEDDASSQLQSQPAFSPRPNTAASEKKQ